MRQIYGFKEETERVLKFATGPRKLFRQFVNNALRMAHNAGMIQATAQAKAILVGPPRRRKKASR